MRLLPENRPRWRSLDSRTRTLIVSAVALMALLGVAFLLPVPYVKLAPGPTFNVIGDVDGTSVIEIEGTETFPVTGQIDMTTVSESGGPRGGLTFVDAIAAWLNPSDAVVPRELLYPDEVSADELRERGAALFSTAESDAIGAALNYLGLPSAREVVVTAVVSQTPAEGIFEPRDRIRAINGSEITSPADVVQAVQSAPVGTEFAIEVDRHGEQTSLAVMSAANPDNDGKPFIGISVGDYFTPDFRVDFTLQDIGGPSAGLIFATGLIDKLTPDNITGGGHVAGTGTISPDGTVGPIGGIRQKLAGARESGAEIFLMPAQHCAEAEGFIPDGLTVVPVATLDEAMSALEAWRAGGPLASCPISEG